MGMAQSSETSLQQHADTTISNPSVEEVEVQFLVRSRVDRDTELARIANLRAVSDEASQVAATRLEEQLHDTFVAKRQRTERLAEVRRIATHGSVAAVLASRFRDVVEQTIASTPPTHRARDMPQDVAELSQRRIVSSLLSHDQQGGFRGQLEDFFRRGGQTAPRHMPAARTTHAVTMDTSTDSDSDLDDYDVVHAHDAAPVQQPVVVAPAVIAPQPRPVRQLNPMQLPRELADAMQMARMLMAETVEVRRAYISCMHWLIHGRRTSSTWSLSALCQPYCRASSAPAWSQPSASACPWSHAITSRAAATSRLATWLTSRHQTPPLHRCGSQCVHTGHPALYSAK